MQLKLQIKSSYKQLNLQMETHQHNETYKWKLKNPTYKPCKQIMKSTIYINWKTCVILK